MLKLSDDMFDAAIEGVLVRCGQDPFIVYSESKVIDILVDVASLSPDDALEYFEFNIQGAWLGDGTPGFLYRATAEEIEDEWSD